MKRLVAQTVLRGAQRSNALGLPGRTPQGGELLLVVVFGGIRPDIVRDATSRVDDAGALLRQLQGSALGFGEHRGLER